MELKEAQTDTPADILADLEAICRQAAGGGPKDPELVRRIQERSAGEESPGKISLHRGAVVIALTDRVFNSGWPRIPCRGFAGRYMVQIWFFQEHGSDVLKGELPLSLVMDGV
jgi:hypothetical protein